MTIAAMLLVDGQGGTQTWGIFKHSEWQGLTFTDCIAPSFMWIVGVSMCISLHNRVQRGDSLTALLKHIFRRSAILFVIGVALNLWLPIATALVRWNIRELESWLLMGTLQRIALAFLMAGFVMLAAKDVFKQIVVGCGLLALYTFIFYAFPAPGFSAGDFSGTGNAVSYLDRLILVNHSNLSHPVLNSIPAAVLVLLGALAGRVLLSQAHQRAKGGWISMAGTVLLAGGLAQSLWVPINYRLWTPSFVLVTGGLAFLSFGLCYWVLDVRERRFGIKWLRVLGLNPIVMWILAVGLKSLLEAKGWVNESGRWRSIWTIFFEQVAIPQLSMQMNSLLFSFLFVAVLYMFAHMLYSRNIIIRI